MTEEEITQAKADIDALNQFEMCRLWRHAPSGHPYFQRDNPLSAYFEARFNALGGMTPAISKALG